MKRYLTKKDALSFLTLKEQEDIQNRIKLAELHTSAELKVLVVAASSVIPRLREEDRKRVVYRRACKEFKKLGIHNTENLTGVLVMISLEEHLVQILAGEAINKLVPDDMWPMTVEIIAQSLASDEDKSVGICNAIARIGCLMAMNFPASGRNPNEISDEIIFKGRR